MPKYSNSHFTEIDLKQTTMAITYIQHLFYMAVNQYVINIMKLKFLFKGLGYKIEIQYFTKYT